MKKIIFMITMILSTIVLSLTTSNAVIIEKTMDFSIVSRQKMPEHRLREVINVNEDLYSKLANFTQWGQEFDNQNDPHNVTIKKGPLTYNGRISHRYHLAWDIHIYTVGIEYQPNTWASIAVYPTDFTVPLSPPFDVNIGFAHFSYNSYLEGISDFDVLGNYTIYAMLEGEIETGDGIDVSNNFSLIPSTVGTLENAKNSTDVGYVYFIYDSDDLFETYIILAGEQYNLGLIELPGVTELNQMPLNPGIYWTENNKRYIYYEFQQPASVKPINEQLNLFLTDIEQINGFRPYVTLNLTDSTYSFVDKLTLYSGFYGGPNGQAYVDVVFPFELDQLLSIEFNYSYRWETLWGLSYTQWQDVNITRYIDEPVMLISTWNLITTIMKNPLIVFNTEAVESWVDWSINKISVNQTYKADYTTHINRVRHDKGLPQLALEQIFPTDSDVYRVYLDTFYDSRYTGYEVHDDIVILDVMYAVDGEVFHVAYDDIESGGSFGGGGPGVGGQDKNTWNWDWLTSFLADIPTEYIFIGLAVIGVVFWKPIKQIIRNLQSLLKNPKDLLIFLVLIGAILYFLGYL